MPTLDSTLQPVLLSQFRAALAMLRRASEACPDALWDRPEDANRSWRIAWHALFYTLLYLHPSDEAFVDWEGAVADAHVLGPCPWPPHRMPPPVRTPSKQELAAFFDHVDGRLDELVPALPAEGPSGFAWLPMTRLELHVYNVRHLQHHAGQLVERLRQAGVDGLDWIGRG